MKTQTFRKNRTFRLATTYLAVIMLMSLIYSVVIYTVSSRQFDRPQSRIELNLNSHPVFEGEIRRVVQDRFNEARDALFLELLWMNFAVLLGGSFLSYFLARWTLRPINTSIAAQEQFVSDVSHELKTPLAVMRTSSEVALRNSKMKVSEAKKVLAQTVASTEQMQTLITTLLLLLQDVEPSFEEVLISDITRDGISDVINYALEKNISIEDTVDASTVLTDHRLASRVVSILLDNAIKYSPENSTITVSCEQMSGYSAITVKDSGIGIAKKDQVRIFDRFYRADVARSSSEKQSYGLGLSLANNISERLKCELRVESKLKKGSTFYFLIPKK